MRANNWAYDKSLMERAIPILQALIAVDPHKHYYFSQLGYALKDRIKPDWRAAKTQLDQAITLLGDSDGGSWPYYQFNRAICLIKLDTNFAEGKPSAASDRKAILQDLRVARQRLRNFDAMIEQPYNIDIRKWRQLNGAPRLD